MEGAFDVQDEKNRRDEGERKEKLVLFFCVFKDIFKSFSVHKILSLFFFFEFFFITQMNFLIPPQKRKKKKKKEMCIVALSSISNEEVWDLTNKIYSSFTMITFPYRQHIFSLLELMVSRL